MEEEFHLKEVIRSTRKALQEGDSQTLLELSNKAIHCVTCFQDPGSITLPVVIYALGKVIERRKHLQIKNWEKFATKIDASLGLAVKAVEEINEKAYEMHLENARKAFQTISITIKPFIEEILRKASINKAGKIYEHGISSGRTAKLLGITQWELAEYTGHSRAIESNLNATMDVRKRALMALEFFS